MKETRFFYVPDAEKLTELDRMLESSITEYNDAYKQAKE